MEKRVKITTLDWILDIIFPCYCKGCGKIGTLFCSCCVFDNMKKNPPFFTNLDPYFRCIFACGMRDGMLLELVSEYKFLSRRRYSYVLSEMLFRTVSRFSSGEKYVIVPLPTISRHIRGRGFDHIRRLARDFSNVSGFPVCFALERDEEKVQVGASAEARLKQAKKAYKIKSGVTLGFKAHYLLIDDVWTTGASMRAARDVLEAELVRRGASKDGIKISAIVLAKNSGYEFS